MTRSPASAVRLEAVAAAKSVHQELDLKNRVTTGGGLVDVFAAISELDIPLVFKPLNSALGLCLPAPLKGIIVTTKRGLHIQRFTAAHELGHVILEHQGSIDQEILERGPLEPTHGRDLKEVAADAFAAEFVLPRWLYRHHIRAQSWTVAKDLRDPDVIYQLSLRMGASYEATCWGLVGHEILDQGSVDKLRKATVARLKGRVGGEFKPANGWADAWRLTSKDNGSLLYGSPNDLVRIELDEAPGSGYQWQIEALSAAGYEILSDESTFSRTPLLYGAPSTRILIARPPERDGLVTLREENAWSSPSSEAPSFTIGLRVDGPEPGGISRAERRRWGIQT